MSLSVKSREKDVRMLGIGQVSQPYKTNGRIIVLYSFTFSYRSWEDTQK
jgi:hypothetical protein